MSTSDATRLFVPWLANYLVHSTLLLGAAILILRFYAPRSVQLRERIWRFAAWGGLISASLSLAPGFRPLFAFAPSEVEIVADGDVAPFLEEGAAAEAADPLGVEPDEVIWLAATTPSNARNSESVPEDARTTEREPALTKPVQRRSRSFRPVPRNTARNVLPVATSRPLTGDDLPFPVLGQSLDRPATDSTKELLGWSQGESDLVPLRFDPRSSTSRPENGEKNFAAQTFDANFDRLHGLAATITQRLAGLPSSRVVQALLLLGSLAFLFTLVVARKRMSGDLRDRVQLTSGPVFEELAALLAKAGCKRHIRLSVAPHLAAPVSFGLLRSEIALPPRAEFDLDRAQLRAVLAHELAHCLRRDPTHFTLLVFLERLFFFQPLNRVARREILALAELSCDDQAVRLTGKSLPLASSLAEVARWIIEGPDPAQTAAAMVSKRSPLTERVERLLDDREHLAPAGRHRWFAPLTFALVPAAALGLPGLVVAGSPNAPEPTESPATLALPVIELSTDSTVADAIDEAPTEREAPEAQPSPAPTVSTPSGPPIGLRLSYELFESELDSTEDELSLLEDDLEAAGLLEEFAEPLDRMQERLTSLARKAEAVDRILPHLAPPNGGDE